MLESTKEKMNLVESPGQPHLGQTVHSKCVIIKPMQSGLLKAAVSPSVKEFEQVSLVCVHLFINYVY